MTDNPSLIFHTSFACLFCFLSFSTEQKVDCVINQLRTGLNCCLNFSVAGRKWMCPCTFLSSSVNISKVITSQ